MSSRNALIILGAAACLAGSGLAHSGTHATPAVSVNESTRTAMGALSAPRLYRPNTDYIRCSIAFGPTVDCQARAGSQHISCLSGDPEFVAVVSAMNDDSVLNFRWANNGTCTSIQVYSGSLTAPLPAPATISRADAVTINLTNQTARGIASNTFNSTNDLEFIGCSFAALPSTSTVTAQCFASSSTGQRVTCNVPPDNAELLQIIRAMHATSSVEFDWEGDALPRVNDAVCTYIRVLTSSDHVPLVRHQP